MLYSARLEVDHPKMQLICSKCMPALLDGLETRPLHSLDNNSLWTLLSSDFV